MSSFKTRADYFMAIAENNRLIAHGKTIDSGGNRKSFHRLNDEEEFEAACVNWAHFPCVVHVGFDLQFKQLDTGKPREVKINQLSFLDKATDQTAESIEAAYDGAAVAMKQFISWMVEDVLANGNCGDLFLFDVNRSNTTRMKLTDGNLYGWLVTFEDEAVSNDLVFNDTNWFNA